MSALVKVAGKFTTKINFRSGILFTIAYADIESLESLHALFDNRLDYMLVKFEQKRLVRTMQKFEVFFFFLKSKNINY